MRRADGRPRGVCVGASFFSRSNLRLVAQKDTVLMKKMKFMNHPDYSVVPLWVDRSPQASGSRFIAGCKQ